MTSAEDVVIGLIVLMHRYPNRLTDALHVRSNDQLQELLDAAEGFSAAIKREQDRRPHDATWT
jgi:hypothetical protein